MKRIIRDPSPNVDICARCGLLIVRVTSQRTGKVYTVNAYRRQPGRVEYDTTDFHSKVCAGQVAPPAARAIPPVIPGGIPPEFEAILPTADDIRLALAVPSIIAGIMALITTPEIRSYLISHDPVALGQVERALRAGGVIPPDTIPVDEQPQVQAEPPMPVEDPGPGTVEGPDLLEDDPGNFDAAAAREEIDRDTKTGRYKEPQ